MLELGAGIGTLTATTITTLRDLRDNDGFELVTGMAYRLRPWLR